MDIIDKSTEYEEGLRQEALDKHISRNKAVGKSVKYCERCGEYIPEARRLAMPGIKLCINCQAEVENAVD